MSGGLSQEGYGGPPGEPGPSGQHPGDHPAYSWPAAPVPPAGPTPEEARRDLRIALLQGLAVIVAFAAVGAACGLLWWHLWTVPTGTVAQKMWYSDEHGLREDFDATGIYVVIAAVASLVLSGLACWRLDRGELVMLLSVLVGSVVAALLMGVVGESFSAPDPQVLAKTAADGTKLPGALMLHSATTYLIWPAVAVAAGAFVYLVVPRRRRR